MPIETSEFETGTRYYWKCPVCLELSLPFRDPERAAAESGRHVGCATRQRGTRVGR